ncbi:MAG: glycosyltransferase family 39 protein [Deltaproteobacteria bacterium]|nr:glycosyltransferase family 39 protein [Deltaproteobacteria bacterium]
MMLVESRPWLVPAAVAVVGALVVLPLLGSSGLWDPHESVAAEVAREAARDGAWLPLTFDGEPAASLPPLFYWIQASFMMVTGTSEWAVRLPLALLGVAWLVAVWALASRVFGSRAGLLSALALATSSFFVVGVRHTSPDLAAAMIFTLALLQALSVLTSRGPPTRRDVIVVNVLAVALVATGGLLPLACLAAALGSGLLTASIPARALARLAPRGWVWACWALPGLWFVGGLATSGLDFAAGLLTVHPHVHGTLEAFARPDGESFTWQIMQAGHMAYPWFIAVPAAVLWLVPGSARLEKEHGEDPSARRACLHALVAVPIVTLVATALVPGYLPLDMLCAAPGLVILSAWGLTRITLLAGDKRSRILLPLGAVLVLLGAGSQGVDYFWNPKRVLETGGYMFDRVYPDLGKIAQAFHTTLAILVGIAAAPAAFARRWPGAIAVTLLATAFAVAGFQVIHVFEKVEPHLSVGPLARAYAGHARDNDRLVAIELDPQIRGGHVFYFEGAMQDAGGLEALPRIIDEAAGKERLVIVTSHVRALYNDVYTLTCGQRIEPLNDERRWYSISALESAPHMPAYRIIVPGGRGGARIAHAFDLPMNHKGRPTVTFLGWNASVGRPGTSDPAPAGKLFRVRRGEWIDLELFFRAEVVMQTGWRVLLDAVLPGGAALKAHHLPACGRHPTHLWKPGEVVRDRVFLYVPSDSEPGTYRLRTGFYRDSERMQVTVLGAGKPRKQVTIQLGTFVVE